jgi:hypothetical protein
MLENPLIDSPEKISELFQEFNEKLGDVVCQAEDGLPFMALAYADKLLPMEIRMAAVKSIMKNKLKTDEGVTYMIAFHCFNHLQEIKSQNTIKSFFSRGKNTEVVNQLNQLWAVVAPVWGVLEGSGRYEKFSNDMLNYLQDR